MAHNKLAGSYYANAPYEDPKDYVGLFGGELDMRGADAAGTWSDTRGNNSSPLSFSTFTSSAISSRAGTPVPGQGGSSGYSTPPKSNHASRQASSTPIYGSPGMSFASTPTSSHGSTTPATSLGLSSGSSSRSNTAVNAANAAFHKEVTGKLAGLTVHKSTMTTWKKGIAKPSGYVTPKAPAYSPINTPPRCGSPSPSPFSSGTTAIASQKRAASPLRNGTVPSNPANKSGKGILGTPTPPTKKGGVMLGRLASNTTKIMKPSRSNGKPSGSSHSNSALSVGAAAAPFSTDAASMRTTRRGIILTDIPMAAGKPGLSMRLTAGQTPQAR